MISNKRVGDWWMGDWLDGWLGGTQYLVREKVENARTI